MNAAAQDGTQPHGGQPPDQDPGTRRIGAPAGSEAVPESEAGASRESGPELDWLEDHRL